MRGNLLQGASSGLSSCFQAFDDSLDISQVRLDGADSLPEAFKLLGKDFVFTASGSHIGTVDFTPALPVLGVLDAVREQVESVLHSPGLPHSSRGPLVCRRRGKLAASNCAWKREELQLGGMLLRHKPCRVVRVSSSGRGTLRK